ncbi:hypothetical protein J2T55_000673 [Methylohalomonas lacus]|uniref:Uncharacterized protein n=1 Tax=Methylohalomonas lacus TaxID=398773 RepID=A0AAE3HKB4_9GAMM|nr:hypothetical protein [Methylohalomonas lacus]MCS3902669.1 hypothetical protein [Methylohalomonas lacus]
MTESLQQVKAANRDTAVTDSVQIVVEQFWCGQLDVRRLAQIAQALYPQSGRKAWHGDTTDTGRG